MLGPRSELLADRNGPYYGNCPVCFHTINSHILALRIGRKIWSEKRNRIAIDCRGMARGLGVVCHCTYYYDCVVEEDEQ